MKKIQFILILLFTYTIVVSQKTEPKLWGNLNNNPNNIKSGDFIRFPKKGLISDGNNHEIFKNVDLIQLIDSSGSVLIFHNEDAKQMKTIDGTFNVQFNKVTKNFAFETDDQKTLTKKSVDNKEYWEQLSIYNKAQMLYEYYGENDSCNYNKLLRIIGVGKENNIIQQLNAGQSCDQVSPSSSKGSQEAIENINSIISSIGGLDVTKYADGLAKFLVKRTKEELTISFFEKFKDELYALNDLQILFPKTHASLQRINEIYDYNRYLTLLRESYHEDFQHLPEKINELIQLKTNIEPKIKFGVEISSKIIEGIQTKQHPGTILSSIDISKNEIDNTIKQSIIFAQVLSEALRDNGSTNNDKYWIDKSKMLELTQNKELFKIFFGLLIEDERIKNVPGLYNSLNNIKSINKYVPLIVRLSDVTQGISSLIKNQKTEDNLSAETVSKYIAYSLELVKISNEGYNILYPGQGKNNIFTTIISILEKSNSIFNEIYTKKYSSAIFSLIDLLNTTFPQGTKEKDLKWLMKYGTFMASCIEAENSDEIAKIIETYALPSGSSRVKRNSYCNIALNSYLGIYGTCKDNKFVSGITAPVGITVSHGSKSFGSISLFLSAIDIGAISAFRFTNDSSQIAKIYLKEILSPGVFLSYGIPKTPISINGGFQSAPLLSRVSTSQNEVNITYQPRWSVSVLVDIPLLNIYNKTSKPKCKEE